MKQIEINSTNEYKVLINEDFSLFNSFCLPYFRGEKVCVITDSNVYPLYYNIVKENIKDKQVFVFVIKAKEKSKSIKTYYKILNYLADNNFTRKDTIIALGGGVAGDIAGFVASTYMRGIDYISIPTTLLSMVDSCIGGKTAINIKKGKNLCGTFYSPKFVYVCLDFLKTLPIKQVKNGYGEIIKYAFLTKEDLINDNKITSDLIYNCLRIKTEIIEQDEKECGVRKLLNFGHTFGHAIEKANNFKLSHGECVVYGVQIALEISKKFYSSGNLQIEKLNNLTKLLGINTTIKINKEKVFDILLSDKKRNGESIDIILIDDSNNANIESVEIEKLRGLFYEI